MRSTRLLSLTAALLSMAGAFPTLVQAADPTPPPSVNVADIEEANQYFNGWLGPGYFPSIVVSRPGATFLRLHFSSVYIPDGAWVELANASGEVLQRFNANDVGRPGNDYYAKSIESDAIKITMRHDGNRYGAFSMVIDRVDVANWQVPSGSH
jgi:hypothetical protein